MSDHDKIDYIYNRVLIIEKKVDALNDKLTAKMHKMDIKLIFLAIALGGGSGLLSRLILI